MQINIYSIEKKEDFKKEIEKFIKKSKPFAIINNYTFKLLKSTNSQKEYSKLFEQKVNSGYNIILTPDGKLINSFEFSNLLNHSKINFFIAGAYGFDDEFKKNGINISPDFHPKHYKWVKCPPLSRLI